MPAATDDHEGPRSDGDAVSFHLSRKEPSRDLMWMAGSFGVALLFAWFGGKLDGQYVLIFVGLFLVFYIVSYMDETKAEEDRSIKLRIGPDGMEIPEKFQDCIAWADIENVFTTQHKSTTTLHVVPFEATQGRIPVNDGWRRWVHGKGINYHITPLEGDPEDILAAIRRFAPERLAEKL